MSSGTWTPPSRRRAKTSPQGEIFLLRWAFRAIVTRSPVVAWKREAAALYGARDLETLEGASDGRGTCPILCGSRKQLS